MMKTAARIVPLLLLALIAIGGRAAADVFNPGSRERVEALLGGIDQIPARATIDANASGEAIALLIAVSNDETALDEARVQALSALAAYPGAVVENALRKQVDQLRGFAVGSQTLYLRAAMLSLAEVGRDRSVGSIVGLLDHPVADVRADAARALRTCDSEAALPALRARLAIEESGLVRHELIESIQALAR
jgi:hypothetical protein